MASLNGSTSTAASTCACVAEFGCSACGLHDCKEGCTLREIVAQADQLEAKLESEKASLLSAVEKENAEEKAVFEKETAELEMKKTELEGKLAELEDKIEELKEAEGKEDRGQAEEGLHETLS